MGIESQVLRAWIFCSELLTILYYNNCSTGKGITIIRASMTGLQYPELVQKDMADDEQRGFYLLS